MSTQIALEEGHVSVAIGPMRGSGRTIRLDLVDEGGQEAFVNLSPLEAARLGAELLRRAGPEARLELERES